jgi:hypothetical protein
VSTIYLSPPETCIGDVFVRQRSSNNNHQKENGAAIDNSIGKIIAADEGSNRACTLSARNEAFELHDAAHACLMD